MLMLRPAVGLMLAGTICLTAPSRPRDLLEVGDMRCPLT